MTTESQIPVWSVSKPHIELDCELSEGPFFEETERCLRFVDIVGKKLHRFHVDKGQSSLETLDTGDAVGVTWDIEGDDTRLLVGAKYGFAYLDRRTGELDYIARFYKDDQKAERMRANDGSIDPAGNFLCGAMTDQSLHEVIKEGGLFALVKPSDSSTGYDLRMILSPVTIPNGLGWSSDGKTMYHADSPTYTIWKYDYDPTSGKASNCRPWFVMKHHEGSGEIPPDATPPGSVPDGFVIDAVGDIWTAVWGGSKVLRIRDVDGQGEVVGCVTLPAEKITCPRFVDEDLVVTSAKGGGEWGGCVFRVHVGVKGAPVRKWSPTR